MPSAIDPTVPPTGNATTAAVRANFAAAAGEIGDLQLADIALDGRVTALENAPPPSGAGVVVQVLHAALGTVSTTNTVMPGDNTVPQQTEGGEFLTVTITPTAAGSTLEIEATINLSPSAQSACTAAIFRDATADAIAAAGCSVGQDSNEQITVRAYVAAGSTDQTVIKLRAGQSAAGTMTVNGWGGNQTLGGVAATTLVVRELAAA